MTASSASKSRPRDGSVKESGSRRAQQDAGAALVDERIGQQLGRQVGTTRLPGQPHMAQEGRSVEPLVGARQGSGEIIRVEWLARDCPRVQPGGERAEAGLGGFPQVEGRLERGSDAGGAGKTRSVAPDDHQGTVAAPGSQRGHSHDWEKYTRPRAVRPPRRLRR